MSNASTVILPSVTVLVGSLLPLLLLLQAPSASTAQNATSKLMKRREVIGVRLATTLQPGPDRVGSVSWQRMSVDPHDEVKRSIRMTADRLLLAPSNEAGERKSRAGILIPATANVDRRLVWAEVV